MKKSRHAGVNQDKKKRESVMTMSPFVAELGLGVSEPSLELPEDKEK